MSKTRSSWRRAAIGAVTALAVLLPAPILTVPASASEVTFLRDFIGTWRGTNGDLTQVTVAKDGGAITVRVWGSCGDRRCLVGDFEAQRYRTTVREGSRGTLALKGSRTPSFATVTYLLTLRQGNLVLQELYDYNEDDSRQDSYSVTVLRRK